MISLSRNSEETIKSVVLNSSGSVAVITLGFAACTYLLLSTFKSNETDKNGLKKLPSPKGAIPYFGI